MAEPPIELSGFHAVKHALRFGAHDLRAWTDDRRRVLDLCERLAPDVAVGLRAILEDLPPAELATLTDRPHPTRLLGRAARPRYRAADLADRPDRPVVHLDHPVNPGNVGAVIRVAAAAGGAGVTAAGFSQLWSPACLRGSAGLHYALPVLDGHPWASRSDRSVVAFAPDGAPFRPADVPAGATLVFGSERDGVSRDVRDRADRVVGLPMAAGVSSLNLATAVAAAVYALDLPR